MRREGEQNQMRLRDMEKRDRGDTPAGRLSQILVEFTVRIRLPPSPSQQWKQRNDQYKTKEEGPNDGK